MMCKATERSRRRHHRAVYIAPSMVAGPIHNHHQNPNPQLNVGGNQQQQQQQQQEEVQQFGEFPPNNTPPAAVAATDHNVITIINNDDDIESFGGDSDEQGVPRIVEIPTDHVDVVSPPSSGQTDLSSIYNRSMLLHHTPLPRQSQISLPLWQKCLNMLLTAYHGLIDLWLLVVVCFLGCFFYDVEVKVVKSNALEDDDHHHHFRHNHHHHGRRRGRTRGRVVIEGSQTLQSPLLRSRTPPSSGNRTMLWLSESQHSRRSSRLSSSPRGFDDDDYAWDV